MSGCRVSREATTVLLCGVGGQGTILAADLLARCAMAAGLDVKLSEVHGMAQRGGAVTTVVRFGDYVASMVTDPGMADHIVAFETTEALRNISFMRSDGTLLVNDESIKPLPVLTGKAEMPQEASKALAREGACLIPAARMAKEAGSVQSSNVVLLGALAYGLDFALPLWEDQIRCRVPAKTVDANLKAFHAGFQFMQGVR